MPARHFLPGMDAFRPRRSSIPAPFFGMSREEIVEHLINQGFSRKVAERDAQAFLAYVGATGLVRAEASEEVQRNASVSENSPWDRLINAFRRR